MALKVSMYVVAYEGEKRTETPFEELPEEERKKLGRKLTDRFMERAGFSPAPEQAPVEGKEDMRERNNACARRRRHRVPGA